MIDPRDVLRVVWPDLTETFTMLRGVGGHEVLSTVSRDPVTAELHCHTCHTSAHGAGGCECIIAARTYCQQKPGGRG
jgi:hypothetical protein